MAARIRVPMPPRKPMQRPRYMHSLSVILYLRRADPHLCFLLKKYTQFSVYNTCTLLYNNVKYVDANLDAPDNAISGIEPSSEMLTSQSQIPE